MRGMFLDKKWLLESKNSLFFALKSCANGAKCAVFSPL